MQSILRTCALRRGRIAVHRTVRFSRNYNGNPQTGPHTTYFQPPPPPPAQPGRRIWRSILLLLTGTALGVGGHAWLYGALPLALGVDVLEDGQLTPELEALEEGMATAVQDAAARSAPPMDLERCQEMLESRSGYSVTQKAVSHTAQLPSNLPCEDTWNSGAYTFFNDPAKDWCEWTIFDGHAGPRTAQFLKEWLPVVVGERLMDEKCLERPYVPNDWHILNTIKKVFRQLDDDIVNHGLEAIRNSKLERAEIISAAAASFSGSCALLALYDPSKRILRVANVGDSRAVLGRWDHAQGKYVAQPMSLDQTGKNDDEFDRITREHPGEDNIVDRKTGRVHGLAVSRAFGDARWKWPHSISQTAHENYWGPVPRGEMAIKTPPYLTAEPEIMETQVQTGEHPDFLIMGSDGLWDNMTSQDAVTCVQMWLDKNKPTNFLDKAKSSILGTLGLGGKKDDSRGDPRNLPISPFGSRGTPPGYSSASELSGEANEDWYTDPNDDYTKWRTTPNHFVVEDENCGIHLVKNSLGGKRRDLFKGLMTVQPPLSRNVRDDITVHVVFFGVDIDQAMKS